MIENKTHNLKSVIEESNAIENNTAEMDNLSDKPLKDMGMLLAVKNMCNFAINVSYSSKHATNNEFTDSVITTSFNLVKLCYMAYKTGDANAEARNDMRDKIAKELNFLCMLLIFAFGTGILGNSAIISNFSQITIANFYLLFIVQATTLAKDVLYQLQSCTATSNFLSC